MTKKHLIFLLNFIILISIFYSCSNTNTDKAKQIPKRDSTKEIKNSNQNENYDYRDSSYYWVSSDYINSLDSKCSVCECLSNNELIMLYIDFRKLKIIIQSSIFYFGYQTASQFNLIPIANKVSTYLIKKKWPLTDSIIVEIKNANNLTLFYKKNNLHFKREKFKTVSILSTPKEIFSQSMDMFDQLNILNSRSLLKFLNDTAKSDSSILISVKDLKRYIYENKVSIYCSDDYHYNGMTITGDPNKYYHLEYKKNKIVIYDEGQGRSRFQKVDLTKMKKQELLIN